MGCGSCGQTRRTRAARGSAKTGAVTAAAAPTYDVTHPDGTTTSNVGTLVEARRLARSTSPRGAIRIK